MLSLGNHCCFFPIIAVFTPSVLPLRHQRCLFPIIAVFTPSLLSLRHQRCLYVIRESLLPVPYHCCLYAIITVLPSSVLSLHNQCYLFTISAVLKFFISNDNVKPPSHAFPKATSLSSVNSNLLDIEVNFSLIIILNGSSFSSFPPYLPLPVLFLPYLLVP